MDYIDSESDNIIKRVLESEILWNDFIYLRMWEFQKKDYKTGPYIGFCLMLNCPFFLVSYFYTEFLYE